jgi:hypothetical protein
MTPARKRRIHARENGKCRSCGDAVPVDGPGVVYDHVTQLWMGGAELDTNVYPLCRTCDKVKTADDAKRRGKVRRLQKKAVQPGLKVLATTLADESSNRPTPRPGERQWPKSAKGSRKMRSAPFQTKLRKRMNGTVERKKP